jgi:hypothetical protein
MKTKGRGWSAPLARPIFLRNGTRLETLADARKLILGLPAGDQMRSSWQKAAELLMAAAEHNGDIEAATKQIEAALFMQARLALR